MIFLVQSDQSSGTIRRFEEFADAEESRAEVLRLDIEIELSRAGRSDEVLLLEACDENALRRTHRRYFESISSIGSTPTLAAHP